MANSPRILLLYITDTSGHRQATIAIRESIYKLAPSALVASINAFNYTHPISEKLINKLYMLVIKRVPQVWARIYDNPKFTNKTTFIQSYIYRCNHYKINRLIQRYKPDVIACTQAFPCGLVADYKRVFGSKIPLIGILTDYAPHSYWYHPQVDYYIVPTEASVNRLVHDGASKDQVKLWGIPVHPKFINELDKKTLYEKYACQNDWITVLVMGGSQGVGPFEKLIRGLENIRPRLQVLVITGTNKKLYQAVKSKAAYYNHRLQVFPFIENIQELMEISDVIISKSGGMTVTEALIKKLAFVILNPIPGQENNNACFLEEIGAGVRALDVRDAIGLVQGLIKEPVRLQTLKQNAIQHAKPLAGMKLAELILKLCGNI